MIDLSHRSRELELLDADNIPFAHIEKNMQELNKINTMLGGHQITIEGFKKLAKEEKTLTVCEIGCGGGDNLFAVYKYCKRNRISVRFVGVDLKQSCIEYAKKQYPFLPCEWIVSDYKVAALTKPDIIFSSLFCHHFNDAAIVEMLSWMKVNSRLGFFINDLERNAYAYYAIKLITGIFSSSYLVKNDAPLSVARGFQKNEWKALLSVAHIQNAAIYWKWAFRHLIVVRND